MCVLVCFVVCEVEIYILGVEERRGRCCFTTCRCEESVLVELNTRSLPRSVLCVINCH